MQQLIGRFHPLLVHLPIGILLLACVFQWLSHKRPALALQSATGIAIFWGMMFAVLSAASGYMLNLSGDYDSQLAGSHQWFGISVAVISVVYWFIYKRSDSTTLKLATAALLFVLILITGHLGGSLTHGSDYLTAGLSDEGDNAYARPAIADIQQANIYADVVQPLIREKCISCHGENKQKGKLRLDLPEFIMKGGKEGNDLVPGKPHESELMKRLLLPRNEEKHMPPKEKSQLSENEVELLRWWIQSGASFDKRVSQLEQTDNITKMLNEYQASITAVSGTIDVPLETVKPASKESIQKLLDRGVVVIPVAQNSNYLSINFVSVDSVTLADLKMLEPVKAQLLSLKLSDQKIGDSGLKVIAQLSSLRKLYLDNTAISDSALASLIPLKQLQYLNLVGTAITPKGVLQLKGLPALKSIYLYQTAIRTSDWIELQKAFPAARLDSGNYLVPTLESDTTIMKEKPKKK
ncbi:MAG: hypothetical protein H7Y31_07110 [Chitinophagaceae bacterium]|nr:hypothetical protein [Chitinophagaceae bacterium]